MAFAEAASVNTETEPSQAQNLKLGAFEEPPEESSNGDKAGFSNWESMDPLLKQRVVENNQLPRKDRQPIIQIIREFAFEHQKSIRSVQSRYYQVIKKELEENPAEKSISVSNGDTATVNTTVQMYPCNYPQLGEVIDTRVINLIDYGIFLETDTGYTGFLRLGDVTSEEWLSGRGDLERYFYQGEKLKAKVIKVVEDKIYFSTKVIGGKKPHQMEPGNSLQANLPVHSYSHANSYSTSGPKVQQPNYPFNSSSSGSGNSNGSSSSSSNSSSGNSNTNGNSIRVARGSAADGELHELTRLLAGRTGEVSSASKEVLSELLLTYGPVRVTAKVLDSATDFDQGLWLLRQVKEQLDGEFNRIHA